MPTGELSDAEFADAVAYRGPNLEQLVRNLTTEIQALRKELGYKTGRVRTLEAGLAEYANEKNWEFIREFNIVGWMYLQDDDPWQAARTALAGEA